MLLYFDVNTAVYTVGTKESKYEEIGSHQMQETFSNKICCTRSTVRSPFFSFTLQNTLSPLVGALDFSPKDDAPFSSSHHLPIRPVQNLGSSGGVLQRGRYISLFPPPEDDDDGASSEEEYDEEGGEEEEDSRSQRTVFVSLPTAKARRDILQI